MDITLPRVKSSGFLFLYFIFILMPQLFNLFSLLLANEDINSIDFLDTSLLFTLFVIFTKTILFFIFFNLSLSVKPIVLRSFLYFLTFSLIAEIQRYLSWLSSGIDMSRYIIFSAVFNSISLLIYSIIISTLCSMFLNKELSWQKTKAS